MGRYFTVIASFGIMLMLGGVYAWSIFVGELIANHQYTSTQTQIVFGIIIAIFPSTMILAGHLEKKVDNRILAILSGLFFGAGYLLAGWGNAQFPATLVGIGLLSGIGTGFGYLVALTTPVKWFPEKKGLITGVAAAGFGLAALIMSYIVEIQLNSEKALPQIFTFIGVVYGVVIVMLAFFMKAPPAKKPSAKRRSTQGFWSHRPFIRLTGGIFLGTFSGLLVIGNLKPIGGVHFIDEHILIVGVSAFAISNFAGRLSWGTISDYTGARIMIFFALLFQAVAIFLIGYLHLSPIGYLVLSAAIGFGFGANFVLFARETTTIYGISNLGYIYPFVFMGYALAGIFGPLTGGLIFDHYQSYQPAIYIAAVVSLAGCLLYLPVVSGNKKHTGPVA